MPSTINHPSMTRSAGCVPCNVLIIKHTYYNTKLKGKTRTIAIEPKAQTLLREFFIPNISDSRRFAVPSVVSTLRWGVRTAAAVGALYPRS